MLDLQNVKLVANKQVYTMACLSAKTLGLEAWKNGTVYWGYVKVFAFTTVEEHLFCEAANYGLLLKRKMGLSWKEALEKAKERFNELIAESTDVWTKLLMAYDRDALVCYNGEIPPSGCRFRRFAIKLFGRGGWLVNKVKVAASFLSLIGFGVAVHDFIHQVIQLKGTPYSPEGGYVGFTMLLLGLALSFGIDLKRLLSLGGEKKRK